MLHLHITAKNGQDENDPSPVGFPICLMFDGEFDVSCQWILTFADEFMKAPNHFSNHTSYIPPLVLHAHLGP